MEIVVASDTHKNACFIEKLTRIYPNAILYLHAGDSELNEYELYPFETVKGNCDYYVKDTIRYFNVLGIGICMIHGNSTYGNKVILNDEALSSFAIKNGATIIIHGHTHKPYYHFYNDVHIICPGSPVFPRGSIASYAVILLEKTENEVTNIKVEIRKYD